MRCALSIKSAYFWITNCTKTKDEQDIAHPFKPFPSEKYLQPLLDLFDNEPIVWLEKSRTMLASWLVSAWAAHMAFTRPATCAVFQSEDEDRAVHNVEYCKVLWENSDELLKKTWELDKAIEKQPYNQFRLANGSKIIGIPGDPGKIRSEHPTIVVFDEAAHITEGEESYNVAVATRCPHLICLSSAWPGWFRDATEFATPADWPDYRLGTRFSEEDELAEVGDIG